MTEFYESRDGARLAYTEVGEGRPLVLIHGYFSTAHVNWIKYGHAALLAEHGFRVIMPDLRGHGESAKPHDDASYPKDILADDGLALLEHLQLDEFDLGGYSLGARTSFRMIVRGAQPQKAFFGGMGLDGMLHGGDRTPYFQNVLNNLGTFERGSNEFMAEAFMKTVGGDPVALLKVLDSAVETPEADLAKVTMPALVVSGDQDNDNGSGQALADALPNAKYVEIPGNHMSAVTKPQLAEAVAAFL